MMKPLVSVIIPSFNRANVIGETIESLIKQSYANWEAIIVDDGSADNSLEVIEGFSKYDSRIHCFKRNRMPKGAPVCRNIGIEKAQGHFIVFLDSDDVLAPWCLESRISIMQGDSSLDFAVFPVLLFNKVPGDLNILWNSFNEKNDLERFLGSDVPWQTSSPMWKKISLASHRWDEEALSWQDWEFHIKTLLKGFKYKKIETLPDCFIRRGESERISINNRTEERVKGLERTFIKVARELKVHNSQEKFKNLLAGDFFIFSENIIDSRLKINPLKFYQNAISLQLISGHLYFRSKQYLKLLFILNKSKLPLLPGLLYRSARLLLPKYLVRRETTFSRVELNINDYKILQKKLEEV
ncbi:MAG TPA: glycosyltransferase family 2 protein [Cytophagales bacterium]|nr:glycosyltransferase family 2 protein [Cytophagales bacterium]